MLVVMVIVFGVSLRVAAITSWGLVRGNGSGTLEDFVEFPPVQPHSAAFGAIINFHALAVGHHQVGFSAYRAFHDIYLIDYRCWSLDEANNIKLNSRNAGIHTRWVTREYAIQLRITSLAIGRGPRVESGRELRNPRCQRRAPPELPVCKEESKLATRHFQFDGRNRGPALRARESGLGTSGLRDISHLADPAACRSTMRYLRLR